MVVEIYKGQKIDLIFQIVDQDGTDYDVTGTSVQFRIKTSVNSNTNTVFKSSESGGVTVIDASTGSVMISLVSADSNSIEGDYKYELSVDDYLAKIGDFTILDRLKY